MDPNPRSAEASAEASSEELVSRHLAGDAEAFGLLVARNCNDVRRVIFRVVRNPSDRSDVEQETWIALLRSLPSFSGRSSFRTWLHALTKQTALYRSRQAKRRHGVTLTEALLSLDDPAQDVDNMRTMRRARALLQHLPPKQRATAVLCMLEGQDPQDVARDMGVANGTARQHLFQARATIRKVMP